MSLRDWSLWISALFHTGPWSPAEPASWCMLRSDPALSTLATAKCKEKGVERGGGRWCGWGRGGHTRGWFPCKNTGTQDREIPAACDWIPSLQSQKGESVMLVSRDAWNHYGDIVSPALTIYSFAATNELKREARWKLTNMYGAKAGRNMFECMLLQGYFCAWERK